ncbi:hypothetical protein [Paludisphaera mucosa]|uniref:Uncharacterized protein n=1 Tax=Paludisphaera mucosa TaxID=3030827 RepID=A0ABT6FBB5_9BACT|nr:hypothetical protein [Paludisphaera mucosa]MDG3004876.1 hypothetical protein [Paludisphaera mucosa]
MDEIVREATAAVEMNPANVGVVEGPGRAGSTYISPVTSVTVKVLSANASAIDARLRAAVDTTRF